MTWIQKLLHHTIDFRSRFLSELTTIMPLCSCQIYCKGGRNISESSFRRHKKFRDPVSTFSVEFGAFIALSCHDTANDNFDDYFCIGDLFEAGNEELGNVEPTNEIALSQVEHRIGSSGLWMPIIFYYNWIPPQEIRLYPKITPTSPR